MIEPDPDHNQGELPLEATQTYADSLGIVRLVPYQPAPESPPAPAPEPSLDQLIADIPFGWRVNTLCQASSGIWYCNLANGQTFTRVAAAATPIEALQISLDRLDDAVAITKPAAVAYSLAPKIDLSSIISAAKPPAEPLKRRF